MILRLARSWRKTVGKPRASGDDPGTVVTLHAATE